MTNKPSKLMLILSTLRAFIFGIPTPYGTLRPRAFMIVNQLSTQLNNLQIKYDFALSKNEAQHKQIEQLRSELVSTRKDAIAMSKALKELANHPHILSSNCQDILNGFKNLN